MHIRFEFDIRKAIAAMAYLVGRLGPVDKVKLIKLLYIADRDHFLRVGRPITGDRLCAMPYGPVPFNALNVLNGDFWGEHNPVFDFIHVDDHTVTLRRKPEPDALDGSEVRTLDRVAEVYGGEPTWRLVRKTHDFPEYQEAYQEATSTPIPYELILRHYGGEAGYRHGRAVISPETAAAMPCPFPASEPDL